MLIVVTGQPRSGKTQYAIKLLLDFIRDNDKREKNGKERRNIYADIAGINAPDTAIKLPEVQNQWEVFGDNPLWLGEHDDDDKPDEYIEPNSGSIFIYDECHKVDWIKDTSGALSKHPTTISMNEHGHEDYIIVLITQFPQYIHTHLRGLVEDHYHVKRFNGLKQATVYKWNEFKTTPRAKNAIADCFEKETFRFQKKYYNCYKSASAHDSMKFRLPKEWLQAMLLIAVLAGAMIWRYNHSPIQNIVETGNVDLLEANAAISMPLETVERPFDDVGVESLDDEQVIDDLHAKYLPAHIVELSQSDDVIPTAIIANDKKCWALNKYGERLTIDEELCRIMSTDSTMIPHSRESIDDTNNNDSYNNDVSITPVESIELNSLG